MNKLWIYCCILLASLVPAQVPAQTNLAVLAKDGAWTWYNDPRALFHNGILYFGYVRNSDGKSVLSALNTQTGARTELWSSALAQKDDHNNPALLSKEDGKLLAIHARHGTDQFFSYRLSSTTNPVSPADWSQEFTKTNSGAGVTYANPHQLSTEGGRIYNFMRNQNFNPTVVTSTNGGQTWSDPQLFIKAGAGGTRPYVKYASDNTERIDVLYTDGHPRNLTNSLYHLFYRNGAFHQTDGTVVKNYAALPLLHDSGERGSVIYQYSDVPTNDPNQHIATGRAWCWETAYQTNGFPVSVFTVQRDNVMGSAWSDDRIYYYYARWTGTGWQKRFIAHAGRPLYESEDDYAGGICMDPENPNVIYISSNALQPFDLTTTTNVPLRANARYEIFRGITTDGGLTFNWEAITTNSTVDNLRPYMPRHHTGSPALIWFRGTYTTFTSYNCEIVGLFSQRIPQAPAVNISRPAQSLVALKNLNNKLGLRAVASSDDGSPAPTIEWTTVAGPANAVFTSPTGNSTFVHFPLAGSYTVRATATDGALSDIAETSIIAGDNPVNEPDASRVLWLKLNESTGLNAADASGTGNVGTISGTATWKPTEGMDGGALELDGATAQVIVPDADNLDNTAALTLSFWFKANEFPGDSAGLVSKRLGPGDNNAYTTYLKASDRRIYVDIDGSNNRFSSTTLINTGAWYHVALTFNGALSASQRAQLWINGVLDTTANETTASIPNYTSSLRIGNTHAGATNWLNGFLDDVQVYRRVLTAAEIRMLGVRHRTATLTAGTAPNVISEVSANFAGSVQVGTSGYAVASWEKLSGPGNVMFGNSNSLSSSVRFSRTGNYTVRLLAEDEVADVADDLLVPVGSNTNVFEDWATFHFPTETNPALLTELGDPDLDGVANIFEFAFGMNPAQNDAHPFSPDAFGLSKAMIETVDGTNFLALKIKRPIGRLGLSYSGKVSSDFSVATASVQSGPINNGDGTEILTLRDVVPATEPHRFLKLEINRQ